MSGSQGWLAWLFLSRDFNRDPCLANDRWASLATCLALVLLARPSSLLPYGYYTELPHHSKEIKQHPSDEYPAFMS